MAASRFGMLGTGEVRKSTGITRADYDGLGHPLDISAQLCYVGMYTDATLASPMMDVATAWAIPVVPSQLKQILPSLAKKDLSR